MKFIVLFVNWRIQAVESVLYWKSMALRQGGDNSSSLNENGMVFRSSNSPSSFIQIMKFQNVLSHRSCEEGDEQF